MNEENVLFQDILEEHSGQQIVLYFWATWCKDCIIGIPILKEVQKNSKETVFIFISVDRNDSAWKKGVAQYNLKGKHYFVPTGWKGDLVDFVDLDWIPRFILIGDDGIIKHFNVLKANDLELSSR